MRVSFRRGGSLGGVGTFGGFLAAVGGRIFVFVRQIVGRDGIAYPALALHFRTLAFDLFLLNAGV